MGYPYTTCDICHDGEHIDDIFYCNKCDKRLYHICSHSIIYKNVIGCDDCNNYKFFNTDNIDESD